MIFLIIGFGSVGSRHARNLSALGVSCLVVEPNVSKLEKAIAEGHVGYKSLNELDNNYIVILKIDCCPGCVRA
jgi:phosphoglycerate dehydrogenase-like enzyme